MRYDVTVGERTLAIEVDPQGRWLVDGRVVAAEALAQDGGRSFLVTVESRPREVFVLGGSRLQVDGVEVDVTVRDPRARALRAARADGGARLEVRAPMAGLLKAVHVAEGDTVAAGAALVTLEAMKMENELRAPRAGRVERVAAAAGTKVDGRALLVVLGAAS